MHRYYKVDRSEICGTVACTMHSLPSYTEVTESGLLPYFMQDVAKIKFYRKASGKTTYVLMSGAIGTLTFFDSCRWRALHQCLTWTQTGPFGL